ncbi:MAG: amidohydrolase, partial [Actinobacteria bacterium]|nr:amidohydrolase [Actinomycetota bacterium]
MSDERGGADDTRTARAETLATGPAGGTAARAAGHLTDHPVLDIHIHPCVAELLGPSAHAYIARANPDAYAQIDCLADARATVDYLRAQGVDQAVVLAEEAPVTDGVTTSEWVLEWTAGVPELHAFVCLNPFTDADLVERLDDLIAGAGGPQAPDGVKGIKFLPSYQQFWPNDARMYPLSGRAA